MKGRDTLDDLQHFMDNVIVRCFSEKYALFHKQQNCVRNPQDLLRWKLFHQQCEYFPRRQFITEGDITGLTNKMIDKKTQSRIIMLRHIRVLQEMRKNGVVFYLWPCE